MIKKFWYILLISGCVGTSPKLVSKQAYVYMPDSRFFNCPVNNTYPAIKTLTDSQIATLLVTLDTNNRICKKSIESIRTQLLAAQKQIGKTL